MSYFAIAGPSSSRSIIPSYIYIDKCFKCQLIGRCERKLFEMSEISPIKGRMKRGGIKEGAPICTAFSPPISAPIVINNEPWNGGGGKKERYWSRRKRGNVRNTRRRCSDLGYNSAKLGMWVKKQTSTELFVPGYITELLCFCNLCHVSSCCSCSSCCFHSGRITGAHTHLSTNCKGNSRRYLLVHTTAWMDI